MNEILKFLVAYMGFLWIGGRYSIEKSIGGLGSAALYLTSPEVRISVVQDKGQMFLAFQPTESSNNSEWFDVLFVYRKLIGRDRIAFMSNSEYARYVEENLKDIQKCFSPDCWNATRSQLRALADAEDRRMFPGRP